MKLCKVDWWLARIIVGYGALVLLPALFLLSKDANLVAISSYSILLALQSYVLRLRLRGK